MENSQAYSRPNPLMLELSGELFHLRDLMLNMAEILEEIRLGMATSHSDDVRAEVERYLCRLRKS